MKTDIEHLIWLYSIGLEEVLNDSPVKLFGEQLYKKDLSSELEKPSSLKKGTNQVTISDNKDKKNTLEKLYEEVRLFTEVSDIESYFKKFLSKEFNLDGKNGLFSTGLIKKHNLVVILETPLAHDFEKRVVYSGRKKNLLDRIILSIKKSLKEKDFGIIMAPVLPFPTGEINSIDDFQSYYLVYLDNLIRIIKPSLTLLVGERANNLIKLKADLKREKHNSDTMRYFGIPELEYILSVPKIKKKIWDQWKDLNELI